MAARCFINFILRQEGKLEKSCSKTFLFICLKLRSVEENIIIPRFYFAKLFHHTALPSPYLVSTALNEGLECGRGRMDIGHTKVSQISPAKSVAIFFSSRFSNWLWKEWPRKCMPHPLSCFVHSVWKGGCLAQPPENNLTHCKSLGRRKESAL